MDSFVLSIIGDDRAGLVEALSRAVAEHGGSWERSHMTELAGMFAGVALVHVPADASDAFRDALAPLQEQGLLDVTLRPAGVVGDDTGSSTLHFEVVGADRPGIVHEVSRTLAALGIGIVDLRTWTESAAMDGSPLFKAAASVRLPSGVTAAELAGALEQLSNDLMVDLAQD